MAMGDNVHEEISGTRKLKTGNAGLFAPGGIMGVPHEREKYIHTYIFVYSVLIMNKTLLTHNNLYSMTDCIPVFLK